MQKKTNFRLFPIYIFRVMEKNNVAGNSRMSLSANLLKLGSSIPPRVKRVTNRNNVATEKRSIFFFGGFWSGGFCRGDFIREPRFAYSLQRCSGFSQAFVRVYSKLEKMLSDPNVIFLQF